MLASMTSADQKPRIPQALLFALLTTAGALYVAPRMFRKAFAPPQRNASKSPSDMGLPEEQISLRSVTGTRLQGWFIPVDKPAPVVIVLHGWGGNASLMLPLAPHLHAAGFHSLFIDARNHGHSEHDTFASMPRFAEDLEVAADWVVRQERVTDVGVLGHSVGAGAAEVHKVLPLLRAQMRLRFAHLLKLSHYGSRHSGWRGGMSRERDAAGEKDTGDQHCKQRRTMVVHCVHPWDRESS